MSLRVEREGEVTTLVLDRADKANALSVELVEALLAAVESAARDGTRLLVLRGEGRHFCAGFDFGDLESASDGDLVLRFVRVEELLQALHHLPIPTLALAHGRVFGAGADIVGCCTTRIADPGTSFLMPGPRFGVILGTRRLAGLIGADRARAIQVANRPFDAAEALSMGFVSEVLPAAEWPARLESARAQATTLDRETVAALLARTTVDGRDGDMAALVRSVSRPGLKARIKAFREASKRS